MPTSTFKPFSIAIMFIANLYLLPAHTSLASEWKGHEVERDGITHIVNPSTAVEPEQIFGTTKVWRVGGGDEKALFGPISDVARNGAGISFLMDSQLNTVHVISRDGKYLRSIGREGEGPGEFSWADEVMLLPDGTVCVLQTMPARAVLLTEEGDAAGDHPLPRDEEGGYLYLNGGTVAGGRIVLNLAQFFRKETMIGLKTFFVWINSDGDILNTYWDLLQEQDLAKVTFDEKEDISPIWAAGDDGRFYVNNDWDSYAIEVVDTGGTTAHIIEREYAPLAKTPQDIARLESLKQAGDISPETKLAENHRALYRLLPRDNGELWVLSSRGKRDIQQNTIAKFDVFDRRGRFIRQVTIHGPYVPGRDGFFLIGDFIYVVTNIGEFAGSDEFAFAREDEINPGEISVTCLHIDKNASPAE